MVLFPMLMHQEGEFLEILRNSLLKRALKKQNGKGFTPLGEPRIRRRADDVLRVNLHKVSNSLGALALFYGFRVFCNFCGASLYPIACMIALTFSNLGFPVSERAFCIPFLLSFVSCAI